MRSRLFPAILLALAGALAALGGTEVMVPGDEADALDAACARLGYTSNTNPTVTVSERHYTRTLDQTLTAGEQANLLRVVHMLRCSIDGVALDAGDVRAYKAADESVTSSTTLQDDDALTVSLAASTQYRFRFVLFSNNAGATEGLKVALGGTAGVGQLKAQISLWDDTTNTVAGFARVTAFDSAVGAGLGSGSNYATVDGSIETTTAGTLLLRWAQNVSGGSAATVQRGSNLVVERL